MLTVELCLAFALALCLAMCARLVSIRLSDLHQASQTSELRLMQHCLGSESSLCL